MKQYLEFLKLVKESGANKMDNHFQNTLGLWPPNAI